MTASAGSRKLGERIAPARFLVFGIVLSIAVPTATRWLEWRHALLAGFDVAALLFLLSLGGQLGTRNPDHMRRHAVENDANRFVLLLLSATISFVVLVTIASLLIERGAPSTALKLLIVVTLALAWLFANLVFALHYAHLFYLPCGGRDRGGLEIPGARRPEGLRAEGHHPDYWDFLYFSFTLAMTFQTSDVVITDRHIRRVALIQSVGAFVFNIGILAFTINVLGGGDPLSAPPP